MNSQTNRYHHGDLRTVLIKQAAKSIAEQGIDKLSLRNLGESIGVSRSALYHHFKNKNELLCAVAEQSFAEWQVFCEQLHNNKEFTPEQKFRHYVRAYVDYSVAKSAIYDLMFGRTIWANEVSTPELKSTAYQNFDFHLLMISQWQEKQVLNSNIPTLRLAQLTWSTLHGISKLIIDGVYLDQRHVDELCEAMAKTYIIPAAE